MTRFLLLFLLVPLLAACESTGSGKGGWDDWFSGDPEPEKAAEDKVTVKAPQGCPPATVPVALSSHSIGGVTPLDLRAMVNIAITSSKCEAKDDTIRQTVEVKLDATKGPALKSSTLDVPFFAAVLGSDGDVLAKKMYQTTFDFSGELTDTEELVLIFTLSKGQAESASLFAGLGVSPAELENVKVAE